jgi:hypothetical protein
MQVERGVHLCCTGWLFSFVHLLKPAPTLVAEASAFVGDALASGAPAVLCLPARDVVVYCASVIHETLRNSSRLVY